MQVLRHHSADLLASAGQLRLAPEAFAEALWEALSQARATSETQSRSDTSETLPAMVRRKSEQ